MSLEDNARRVIGSAERLHSTALALRKWAAGYLPGRLPAPLQRIIDAADDYAERLDEYNASKPTTIDNAMEVTTFPKSSVSKQQDPQQ
jgi:hypothetical protein